VITAKVSGLDEVVKNLRALPLELAGKGGGPVRLALYKAAKKIRDDARALVPVGAGIGGHLRDQVILKRDPNPHAIDDAAERYLVTVKYRAKKYKNTRFNRRTGRVGQSYQNFGDFYYWRFVEFGTSKMPARSFLRKAFENNMGSLPAMVRDELAAGIAAIASKLAK
jgi:HK97 gp10 family phage protein